MNVSFAFFLRFIFRFFLRKRKGFSKIYQYYKSLGNNKRFILKVEEGFLMNLNPNDWIQAQLFFIGFYEELELSVMKNYLQKGGVFIDLGANIGLYSLTAASLKDVAVLAFEPYDCNFQLLQENIRLNSCKNIEAINKAVGKESRTSKLYYDELESNLGMVSEFTTQFTIQQSVEFVTLDDYLKKYNFDEVNYIKLDIEGGEYNALLGMKDTLLQYGPIIQMEINESILGLNMEDDIFKLIYDYDYEEFNPFEVLNLRKQYSLSNSRNKFFRPRNK